MPQVLSGAQILDGDESVVALMAKHFGHHGEFPVYFWGQTYGFSLIEVASISLFYLIFGVTPIAVKLAMLALWTAAVLCFYKLMRVLKPESPVLIPFLICLVLIINPAFAVWSLKARGGYLSAFLLSQLFILLLFKSEGKGKGYPILLGILAILIFESQSLWLAGLFPYLAFYIYKKWKKLNSTFFFLSLGVSFLLIKVYKSTLVSFWKPEIFPLHIRDWNGILALPQEILAHFSGRYIYSSYLETPLFAALSSWIFIALILLLLILGIRRLIQNKFAINIEMAALVSLPLAILYMLIIPGIHPRYLLPLIGYVLLSLFILSTSKHSNQWFKVSLFAYLPIGLIALLGFSRFTYDKAEPFYALLDKLEEDKIEGLFSEGGLLQWQIMFYTNEKVNARYRSATDRYPPYVDAVNSLYKSRPEATAIIGHTNDWNAPKEGNFETVAGTYFLFKIPSDSLLSARNFQFTKSN